MSAYLYFYDVNIHYAWTVLCLYCVCHIGNIQQSGKAHVRIKFVSLCYSLWKIHLISHTQFINNKRFMLLSFIIQYLGLKFSICNIGFDMVSRSSLDSIEVSLLSLLLLWKHMHACWNCTYIYIYIYIYMICWYFTTHLAHNWYRYQWIYIFFPVSLVVEFTYSILLRVGLLAMQA